jgi:hypothetical protein
LKDGDEVEVRLEDGKVVIRPIFARAQFKKEAVLKAPRSIL